MRQRTHGKDAKAKREILEERIDEAKKLGSYGAAICFEIPHNNHQQVQTRKGNLKHCTYCKTMTNHKTWRSRNCPGNKEYLKTVATRRNLKKPKLPPTTHQITRGKMNKKIHDNSPITETHKVAYLKKKTGNDDGVEVEEEVSKNKKKLMVTLMS